MNLNDFKILNEATIRFHTCRIADNLMRESALANLLYMGYVPLTRYQRLKNRMQDYKQRAKDIWTILKGEDIHENCGY